MRRLSTYILSTWYSLAYFSSAANANDDGLYYLIKRGDTLSEIALTHLGMPVYGKRGSLQRLLKLNPRISNPNYLKDGTNIKVLVTEEPRPIITPELYAKPSSEPIAPMLVEKNNSAYLAFGGSLGQMEISATDRENGSRARLASENFFGLSMALGQRYSNGLTGEYGVLYEKVRFKMPTNTNIAFKGLNSHRLNLYARIQSYLNESWSLTGTLPIIQGFFIASSVTHRRYEVEKVTLVAPNLALDYSWYKTSELESSIGLEVQTFIPAKGDLISTYIGYGGGPRIQTRQKLGKLDGETTLAYFYQEQKTSLTKQNISQYLLSFRIFLDFGVAK